VKSFVISSSDLARCPTRNLSVSHWREDGTCAHELPKEAVAQAGIPMPGQKLDKSTVVASVVFDDEHVPYRYTVVLLNRQPPYYTVQTVQDGGKGRAYVVEESYDYPNIVPAVRAYEQMGGDW
jgi:hypothetical protein